MTFGLILAICWVICMPLAYGRALAYYVTSFAPLTDEHAMRAYFHLPADSAVSDVVNGAWWLFRRRALWAACLGPIGLLVFYGPVWDVRFKRKSLPVAVAVRLPSPDPPDLGTAA